MAAAAEEVVVGSGPSVAAAPAAVVADAAGGEDERCRVGGQEGEAVAEGAGRQAWQVRRELVALLLQFLKEYLMREQEGAVRALLRDIQAGGRDPRPLGKWGLVTPAEVGEAVAFFEVWKTQGCLGRPAKYFSQTHGQEIEGYISAKNPGGTLDLMTIDLQDGPGAPPRMVKEKADPRLVRHSRVDGWFVPDMPDMGSQAATAAPPASGVPAPSPAAPSPAAPTVAPVPQRRVQVATYAFDGASYGPDYLVLGVGDEIAWLEEDQGWARGKVLRRQIELPSDTAGAALEAGWYPAAFVRER